MNKVVAAVCTFVLMLALAACSRSEYAQELLERHSGVKVAAENAGSGYSAMTEEGLVVKEGEVMVVSPVTDKGSFHLTVTSSDGSTTIYDEDVSGDEPYSVDIAPGRYNVATSANDVTGYMSVYAQDAKEFEEDKAVLSVSYEAPGLDTGGDMAQEEG